MTIQETLEQEVTPPVVVHETPLPDQLWALLRQLLPPVVAFLVARNYITNDVAEIATVAVGIGLPIIIGQLKTRLRALQLAMVERRVDDSILTTKAKAEGPL